MDHLFEQKLVRENRQLELELAKLNKQIKQLQEKVVGYEQVINEFQNVQEGTKAKLDRLGNKAFRGKAFADAARHKLGQLSSAQSNLETSHGSAAGAAFAGAVAPRKKQLTGIVKSAEETERSVTGGGAWNNPLPGSPLDLAIKKRITSLKGRVGKVSAQIAIGKSLGKDVSKLESRLSGISSATRDGIGYKSISTNI